MSIQITDDFYVSIEAIVGLHRVAEDHCLVIKDFQTPDTYFLTADNYARLVLELGGQLIVLSPDLVVNPTHIISVTQFSPFCGLLKKRPVIWMAFSIFHGFTIANVLYDIMGHSFVDLSVEEYGRYKMSCSK